MAVPEGLARCLILSPVQRAPTYRTWEERGSRNMQSVLQDLAVYGLGQVNLLLVGKFAACIHLSLLLS